MRIEKGQNIIEFIIIIALIAIAGIVVYMILGQNIHSIFEGSTKKTSEYKPFKWESSGSSSFNTPIPTGITENINGINVSLNKDGSKTFEIAGQTVNLTKELADFSKSFEVAGSSNDILITEIAYMINKYKDEYPDSDVPVEVWTGKSSRTDKDIKYYGYADGIVETNNEYIDNPSIVIKIGDHLMILQNEINCTKNGNVCKDKESQKQGQFKIEGDLIYQEGKTIFNAQVTKLDIADDKAKLEEKLLKIKEKYDKEIAKANENNDTKKIAELEARYNEDVQKEKDKFEGEIIAGFTSTVAMENGIKFLDTTLEGKLLHTKLNRDNKKPENSDEWVITFDDSDPRYEL
jgi:Flp pilus assembly pilin Flp